MCFTKYPLKLIIFCSFEKMASSMDIKEGEIFKSATYNYWELGHCIGRGTCSVVVEAAGTLCSSSMRRRPRVLKGAAKIFKQGPQFEHAATNEIEILQYLSHQGESSFKYYIGELRMWY